MTPQEFEIEMLQCFDFSDPTNSYDAAHYIAIALMCGVLSSLGYGDGVDVFNRLDKIRR